MKTASLDEYIMMMKLQVQIAILIASLLIKVKTTNISEATGELESHRTLILTLVPVFSTCLDRNTGE